VLAASIFHWGPNDMMLQVKDAIRAAGFEVR
jgi:cyclase